jgi:hypothetical protein
MSKKKHYDNPLTKKIKLTKGYFTLVDIDDYEKVKNMKWYVCCSKGYNYAQTSYKSKKIWLSHLIMNPSKNLFVDHINHDTLDNRHFNLRICTKKENNRNYHLPVNNTSGYKGVCLRKLTGKWLAYIKYNGVRLNLGYFKDKIEAAKVYDKKAIELFGKFAYLNTYEKK